MEQQLVKLIQKYCRPYYKIYPLSSYGLKAYFEKLTGDYISNDDFKEAMIMAGFKPCKRYFKNHYYKVKIDISEIDRLLNKMSDGKDEI